MTKPYESWTTTPILDLFSPRKIAPSKLILKLPKVETSRKHEACMDEEAEVDAQQWILQTNIWKAKLIEFTL